MAYLHTKNGKPTVYGLGEIGENMLILGTFDGWHENKNGRRLAILNLMTSVFLNFF